MTVLTRTLHIIIVVTHTRMMVMMKRFSGDDSVVVPKKHSYSHVNGVRMFQSDLKISPSRSTKIPLKYMPQNPESIEVLFVY